MDDWPSHAKAALGRGSSRRRSTRLRGAAVLVLAALSLAASSGSHFFALPSASQQLDDIAVNVAGTAASPAPRNILWSKGLGASRSAKAGVGPFAGKQLVPIAGSALSAQEASARATDATSSLLAAAGAALAARAAISARRCLRAASADGKAAEGAVSTGAFEQVQLALYIGLWYIFNIGYNIYNKKALIAYPFPWACALWQMVFGWFIFVPLWLLRLRKAPRLSPGEALTLSPAAFGHLATHAGAVVAFSAGAVSFGHIVKASEPVVSSFLNFLFMGEAMRWQVYASLLPIIGGVALASVSELSFNWLCFGAAMASNVGSAGRAVYSKKVMSGGRIGENMDSANVYAVLTIMATFLLLPIALAIEGPTAMLSGLKAAYATGGTEFLLHMLYTGFFYYMYNEVAFMALGKLDPVSHAVSNTMKRVVIIVTSVLVFRTAVTPLGAAGSCIAILGTLLYSLAKNKFK
eukprot:TRINITY_DN22301_c0_g5_i1.p1 TRINITY_DN22301_c0_g5~~TRINITY_DN22301_c0_g5_i1.p1  ORF type:complete len:497 (+),score=125.31 TRINITY_DN22301_c0_g5_i1:98-1492(+)